jgi:hypothetical protein
MGQPYSATQGVHSEASEHVLRASRVTERMDATEIDTAGDATYTMAQLLGGIIYRDCASSARSDVLPTAALVVQNLKNPQVGDIVRCLIINNSDAAETITLVAGTDGAFAQIEATRIIPQNTSREVFIRVTGVSTPAYVAYM